MKMYDHLNTYKSENDEKIPYVVNVVPQDCSNAKSIKSCIQINYVITSLPKELEQSL